MDQFAPATANYNPPATKPTTLADMLGLATSAQGLQQQQQATQTGAMALTINQAKFQEQQGIQKFMADSKNYLDQHGDVDMGRVMKTVPNLFPFLGTELTNHLSEMAKGQSVSMEAKLGLTKAQRGLLADTLTSAANNGAKTLDEFQQAATMLQEANPGVNWKPLTDSYWKTMQLMGVTPDKDISRQIIAGAQTLKGEGTIRISEDRLPHLSPSGQPLIKQTDLVTGQTRIIEDTSDEYASSTQLRPSGGEPANESAVPPSRPPSGKAWDSPWHQEGRGTAYLNIRPGTTLNEITQQAAARSELTQSIQSNRQILGDVETVRNYAPFAITGGLADYKNKLSNWWGSLDKDEKARITKTATDVANKSLARLRGSIYASKSGQSATLLNQIELAIPGLEANPEAIMTVMDQIETAAQYPLLLDRAITASKDTTHRKDQPYIYNDTINRFNEVSDLKTMELASLHERSRNKEEFKGNIKRWVERQGISKEEYHYIEKQYKRLELLLDGDLSGFDKSGKRGGR